MSPLPSEIIFLPKEAGERYLMVPTRMDPPEHTPYRKTLDKRLNLAHMRRVEDDVRRIAVELIEGLAPNGRCDAMPSVGTDLDRFHLGDVEIMVESGRCVDATGMLAADISTWHSRHAV